MTNYIENILSIKKTYVSGIKAYRVELKSNYCFDFSGSDITVVKTISDIRKITRHIVFCDGT